MPGTRTRRLLVALAALALTGAACGSDDDGSTTDSVLADIPSDRDELGSEPRETTAETPSTEATATDPPSSEPASTESVSSDPATSDPASDVLRLGLQVTSVDFTTGVAVITNLGDRDVDLTDHWICNRPNYAQLPTLALAPGESVEASLGGFSDVGGEVAVYSSSDFGNPDDIESYVGWGSGGGRNAVAEAAGIWTGQPVQPSGDSIELTGEPGSADGWT